MNPSLNRLAVGLLAWLYCMETASAGVVKIEFTNNSGKAASDLHLVWNKNVAGGIAGSPFDGDPTISGTNIDFFPSSTTKTLPNKGKVTATTSLKGIGPYNLVTKEWSFPDPKADPNIAIPMADMKMLTAKLDLGAGGLIGLVSLTNSDPTRVAYFSGFAISQNIPALFFDDTPAALALLNDNDLFFASGSPVTFDPFAMMSIPSAFSLEPGETRTFQFLGVNDLDFLAATFTVDFTPTPSDFAVRVTAASADIVPEPSALALLGAGSLGVAAYRWRRRSTV